MNENNGINVLSLFNGLSCGHLALDKIGIKVDKYYSSEIDKHAIQVCQHNYPDTVQLGDVTKWREWDIDWSKIDLLLAGSPCQGFSFAGKQLAFDDPRSKLFFVFVDILNHIKSVNPNVKWLLENVRMKKEHEYVISKTVGIEPVIINSALLSAQNRVRLYWNNFYTRKKGLFETEYCNIPQPKDLGILLKDVLESDVPDKYFLSDKVIKNLQTYNKRQIENGTGFSAKFRDTQQDIKMDCLKIGGGGKDDLIVVHNLMPRSSTTGKGGSGPLNRKDGKTYCLDTGNTNAVEIVGCVKFGRTDEAKEIRKESMKNGKDYTPFQAKEITGIDFEKMNTLTTVGSKDNLVIVAERGRQDENGKWVQQFEQNNTGKTNTITSVQKDNLLLDKSPCLHGFEHGTNGQFNRQLGTGGMIRRLTPIECARLQTIPDGYFINKETGKYIVSETQVYRQCGNGWTVDVIAYLLSFMNK
jgi:DNA (cytosine-5)-methyltransferase 3A